MSGEGGGRYPGPTLVGVGTQVPCLVEGVGSQVPFTYLPPCEQTNAGENITFPLLRLREVMISLHSLLMNISVHVH